MGKLVVYQTKGETCNRNLKRRRARRKMMNLICFAHSLPCIARAIFVMTMGVLNAQDFLTVRATMPESNKSPTTEHKKVVLDIRDFGTICPDCGVSDIYLSAQEQPNGIDFEPELSDKFIECFKCGCLMEVVGVRIEPLEKINARI